MMKVSFYTLGCTVNHAETQKMRRLFIDNGARVVSDEPADAIIINSCAVTSAAEKSAVKLLNRLRRKNPSSVIALVGCYGALVKQRHKEASVGADILVGNDKSDIVRQVHQKAQGREKAGSCGGEKYSPADRPDRRAFLLVQSGCGQRCSYCIVPSLRGMSVSIPFGNIKAELVALVSQGYNEIVMAGTNLGLYRHMDYTFMEVLQEANAVHGLECIRLSSLEPVIMTNDFIERLPEITKLSPHFHVSLQSGSNKVLSLMKRDYTFEVYLSGITKLRRAIKNAVITTDIIVGFPGESEDDFQDSCHNIVTCNFNDIHIFKYSKRDGTEAAYMQGHVTEHKKTLRAAQLQG